MSPLLRSLLFAVPAALLALDPAHAEGAASSSATVISALATPSVTAPAAGSQSSTSSIRVTTTTGQANGGRTDIIRVRVGGASNGNRAVTTLYKRVDERNVRITSKRLDSTGAADFRTQDLNERRYTKYFVEVAPTEESSGKSGPIKWVR